MRQAQGRSHGGPSSLEHLHLQRVRARPQAKGEPQRRRRGFVLCLLRAEHEAQPGVLPGAGMQAANLFGARLWEPAEHGAHAAGFEGLLGGPQPLGRGVDVDPDQPLGRDAPLQQAWEVRWVWRADEQDAAALLHQLRQAGCQQAPLSLATLHLQDFGERLPRPPPAWQLGIEQRVPAAQDQPAVLAQGLAWPDSLGQVSGQGGQGRSGYCMHVQYRSGARAACPAGVSVHRQLAIAPPGAHGLGVQAATQGHRTGTQAQPEVPGEPVVQLSRHALARHSPIGLVGMGVPALGATPAHDVPALELRAPLLGHITPPTVACGVALQGATVGTSATTMGDRQGLGQGRHGFLEVGVGKPTEVLPGAGN